MIRIVVDVLGREAVMLAELRIVNDGTGNALIADYKVTLTSLASARKITTTVTGFNREEGALRLVQIALERLLQEHPRLGIAPR